MSLSRPHRRQMMRRDDGYNVLVVGNPMGRVHHDPINLDGGEIAHNPRGEISNWRSNRRHFKKRSLCAMWSRYNYYLLFQLLIVVLIFDSILNHTDDNFVATATVVLIVVMHSLDDERRVGNGIIALHLDDDTKR